MRLLISLFFEFLKIGLFAVGGGAATIPFLAALSDKTGWFTKAQLANMVAISESTPGAIGVNMSTYVGYEVAGIPGCLVATAGLVFPCVVVILIVASVLNRFKESKIVKNTFYGLRPASTGLIAAAAFEIIRISLINIEKFAENGNITDLFSFANIILFAVLFFAMKKIKFHPIFFIAVSAIVGIVFKLS